ncbi:MAG: hypothetical protein IKW76_04300, partial [Clostridia bacterium]|nr:hypothetical protein [Clostridia bacterium]
MNKWKRIVCCVLALLCVSACFAVGMPYAAAEERKTSGIERPASAEDEPLKLRCAWDRPETEPGTILFTDPETDALTRAVPFAREEGTDGENRIYFNSTNFPDKIFRQLLIDTFGQDYMTELQSAYITVIDVSGMGIGSLTGIKYFSRLKALYCGAVYDENGYVIGKNKLSSLSLTVHDELDYLYCDNNNLKSVDLSALRSLNYFICDYNPITKLDVSNNKGLIELYCGHTKITKIDCSECGQLEEFEIIGNELTSFDFGTLKTVKKLYIDDNKLTSVNLAPCAALEYFSCSYNSMKSLDLSTRDTLIEVYCAHNQLTSIKFKSWCNLHTLDCSYNELSYLNFKIIPYIYTLVLEHNRFTELDFSELKHLSMLICNDNNLTYLRFGTSLATVDCSNNLLTEISNPMPQYMQNLDCSHNRLQSLDMSQNEWMRNLFCNDNEIGELNLSKCDRIQLFDCSDNQLEQLDLTVDRSLKMLDCSNNRLVKLDLPSDSHPNVELLLCGGQRRTITPLESNGDKLTFDIHALDVDPARVSAVGSEPYSYSGDTGVFTFMKPVSQFMYDYDTGSIAMMDVTLLTPYEGSGTIKLTDEDVEYKGATPYMVYTGAALAPAFSVYDETDAVIDPSLYTYTFSNNRDPGNATLKVSFIGTDHTCSTWFKILLPGTTSMSVENVQDGIQVKWARVNGAKGYVIYRRAWNLVDNGWTEFARWNNTTETTYIDGMDASHKVYAGTRYQYGVKAYYSDPMDNYNLGVVGPLKTTVRITTRKLTSVTGGSKQLTVKWEGSKNFTGYEVQIATDAAFTKNVKTVKITDAKTYQTTIK